MAARLFFGRRGTKRACVNAAEVQAEFAAAGFEIVFPEDHSLADQVELVRRAEVLAGYAGSAMFHVALAGAPKHVVLVVSESYPAHNEYLMSMLLGHRLDVVVCEALLPRVDGQFTRGSFHSDFVYRPGTRGRLPARGAGGRGARLGFLRCGSSSTRDCTSPARRRSRRAGTRRTPTIPTSGTRAEGTAGRPAITTWSVRCSTAFTEGRDVDLVAAGVAWSLRATRGESLEDVVAAARERGVATLLISSEDLDRARQSDREALDKVLGGEDVTLVVTATRPAHRWCSGWQTLVKHGLAQYPRDAEPLLLDFAGLRPGRLAELLDLVPSRRRVVRLVRSSPPEPDLAADLAGALGVPDHELAAGRPLQNTSLGTDTEVVLRINRADLALGTNKAGKRLLAELRGAGFSYRDDAGLAERYALTDAHAEGAAAEAAWLAAPEPGVEVLDPHGLLTDWADPTVPEWYAEVSRREAVVPALEPREDRETQLWRVRQERAAYQRRLQRVQGRQ